MQTTTVISPAQARKAAQTFSEADNRLQAIKNEIMNRCAEIELEYAKETEVLNNKVKKSKETLQAYAEQNREELFTGKKSTKLGAVTFGFKLTPGKLALKANWDWKKALAKVKELLPDYVKTKEELDKTKLKNNADELGKTLTKCGMQIVQEESFTCKVG